MSASPTLLSSPTLLTDRARYTADLIGNRPNAVAYGPGWYFATDDNGGTLYHSDGTAWTKETLGLNWASGTQLAYAEDTALNLDVKAVGTTVTDLSTPLRITIPASSVPVRIDGMAYGRLGTATSAVAANATMSLLLADAANAVLDFDSFTAVQVTASGISHTKTLRVSTILPAPVAAGTYKLRGSLAAAAPANWGIAQFISGGANPPKSWIVAVAQ